MDEGQKDYIGGGVKDAVLPGGHISKDDNEGL